MPRNVCGIRACAYGRVRALHGRVQPGTYSGKVRVRSRVPSMRALERASLGATCVDEPALLTVPVQVHVIVRVRVGFCAIRAHVRFVQCATAVSSCSCSTARGREHVVMRSRALCSCVGTCTEEFMYDSQYLSTVLAPPGLCTSVCVCTIRTPQDFVQCASTRPQGFVLLRTSVRCEPKRAFCGANPQGCSTVCWYSPTRALYPMLMCSCGSVRSEPARACASVYGASLKSFVRCEPTKASYSVLLLSPQGFAPSQCFCVRYEPQGL